VRAGRRSGSGWRGGRRGLRERKGSLELVREAVHREKNRRTEENILEDYGLLRQTKEVVAVGLVRRRIIGCLLLDSCPSKVDVEE
jgi:hypothetical protein